jgi:TolB-like protein/tetratricopeptide (TPR) repeat protein
VTPERWQLVERVYHAALEQAVDARTAFLADACGADPELLADVQSLLASHGESSSFLELPVLHQSAAALANRTLHALIGHRIDKYRVRDLLGSGGMGAVYLAHDEELGRDVAIKLLIDERAESPRAAFGILNEARAAACLNHPNICTVHEVVQFEGRPYLVMEYVAGLTLDRLIAVRGLSLDEVLRYGSEIADAIAHAHASGVLHRDLKTANVMVSAGQHVKVVDFGIARRLDADMAQALTGGRLPVQPLVGTPAYMSPELLRGYAPSTESDLWALGVVLYEMATGEHPFKGGTEYEVAAAILQDAPAPLSKTLPVGFRRVVERCLGRESTDRYKHAAEIRDALSAITPTIAVRRQGQTWQVSRPEPTMATRSARATRQGRWRPPYLVMVAAVLAASILGSWAVVQNDDTRGPGIAVLPVVLINSGPQEQYLSVGVATSITERLARIRSLRVLPTTSVVHYEGRRIDPRAVGRELGVRHLLLSTLRTEENAYRISVQLVETRDAATLSAGSFSVGRNSLMDVEAQVADRVVKAFNLGLSTGERLILARQYTSYTAAYTEYLKGRAELARRNRTSADSAISAFNRALEVSPDDVRAHAGLAVALARKSWHVSSSEEASAFRTLARDAAHRALRLDPEMGEAYDALAAVYRYSEFEWDKAIDASRRALELNANLDEPHYHMAVAFYHLGLFDLSEQAALAGLAANPSTRFDAALHRGRAALYDGRYVDAVRLLEEARRYASTEEGPAWMLAEARFYLGETKEAARVLRTLEASDRRVPRARAQASLAGVLASMNARADAEARLNELTRQTRPDHHAAYRIGTAYAQLGDVSHAMQWLTYSASQGFPCLAWFEEDPLLDRLRRERSFQALLDKMRPEAKRRRTAYRYIYQKGVLAAF